MGCSPCSCALWSRLIVVSLLPWRVPVNTLWLFSGIHLGDDKRRFPAAFFVIPPVAGSPLSLCFDCHIGSACLILSPITDTRPLIFLLQMAVSRVKFNLTFIFPRCFHRSVLSSWQVVPAMKPKFAICDNSGFGGHNAALTFKVWRSFLR